VVTSPSEAFLEDIREHPDDDAPRLVYADWLDDHGDADRAEFIRAQVMSARPALDEGQRRSLEKRADDLLAHHEAAWRSTLPVLEGVTWADFSRGFVEAVFVTSPGVFLDQAPALFAAAPVRRLRVGWVHAQGARALARSPYLARLRELNLCDNPDLGEAGVEALAGSRHLAGLTSLLLYNDALGDEAVACLAASPHLAGLTELYLSGNDLGDQGTTALGRCRNLAGLVDLDLRDNRVGDAGVQALAFEGRHERLDTLWLVNNRIGAAGAAALAGTDALPRLVRLYLNYNPIGDEGAIAFAESPRLAGLRELDLRHCDIRDPGGRALAASPHLDGLDMLWLTGNRIGLDTLTQLRRRFGQPVRF
jgi:uncharacterized protein (TIGR02996 family)